MMLGFGSLSVLNFFFPIVFFIFCVWLLCPVQGISFSLISSSLVFISLLKFSHPSLWFRFHFSRMVFFHGRLVAIVVIMVLWSVSFFPFYSTFLIHYVWCGLVYAPWVECIVKWLISILVFFLLTLVHLPWSAIMFVGWAVFLVVFPGSLHFLGSLFNLKSPPTIVFCFYCFVGFGFEESCRFILCTHMAMFLVWFPVWSILWVFVCWCVFFCLLTDCVFY